jgi:hypothetical protein
LHPGGRDVEIEVRQEALKSALSILSSLSRPELIEGDKEESRPKPGRWFDLVAERLTALYRFKKFLTL